MNERHITEFLDEIDFKNLTNERVAEIRAHAVNCAGCRRAFDSARIGASLLKESLTAKNIEPNAFFQPKVLNAWREKQIVQNPLAVFWRWWQASAALVLLMFLTIIGLLTASVIGSRSETADRRENSNVTLYSTETVILNQRPTKTLTTEQIFEVLDDK